MDRKPCGKNSLAIIISIKSESEIKEKIDFLTGIFDNVKVIGVDFRTKKIPPSIQALQQSLYKRSLSSAEFGCALSHLQAYKLALTFEDAHDGFFVFEDDAIFLQDFENTVYGILKNSNKLVESVVFLGGLIKHPALSEYIIRRMYSKINIKNNSLCKDVQNGYRLFGTVGYYIGISACEKFVIKFLGDAVADDWHEFYKRGIINSFYVPQRFVVDHPTINDLNYHSTIDSGRPNNTNNIIRYRGLRHKIKRSARLFIQYIRGLVGL